MSALAQAYLDRGFAVGGADRAYDAGTVTPAVAKLVKQGVMMYPEDGSGIDSSLDAVVVSTAIEQSNPGLIAAERASVPVVHRAAALSSLLEGRRLLAVAGTCGKSTVTAILGHLLEGAGFDPLVVNGAEVVGWDCGDTRVGSVRSGAGEYAVAEVDESDRSLGVFNPYGAIITNASADHYSLEEMNEVFDSFAAKATGPIVDGRKMRPAVHEGGFEFGGVGFKVPLPGVHNALNARHAVEMASRVGADLGALKEALLSFRGVSRRLERMPGVFPVYDDYAHNPEKLHAMLVTLQGAHPGGVAVVWRPHGYAPLRKMMDALASMFRETMRQNDILVLLPVYDAGGTACRDVDSGMLRDALGPRGAYLAGDFAQAKEIILSNSASLGSICVCGARDPYLPVFARELSAVLAESAPLPAESQVGAQNPNRR